MVRGRGSEAGPQAPGPLLAAASPWQRLYTAAHRLRWRFYRGRQRRLPRPVVSVGNLHWGGAGKTPLVAALAAHLRDRGLRVAVLSRGYARRGRGVGVVSTWRDGPLLPPRRAGDEPVLLAGQLPGVAVVVGAERYRAGLVALSRLEPAPELFVLDDGFSHLALARDLDLLAFPAADPLGGGRLPPTGRLREPLAASARADAALVTGFGIAAAAVRRLAEALAAAGFTGATFAAPTCAEAPRLAGGGRLQPGSRVFLVSGIARPGSFRAAVAAAGLEVAGNLTFPDHHPYPESSLRRIADGFRSSGARAVLTTAKDRVKLLGRLDLPLAELPIRARPEEGFWNWLDGRLRALGVTLEGSGR